MITREDVDKVHTSLAQAELFYRLIMERDAALEGKKAAELRAEAFKAGWLQERLLGMGSYRAIDIELQQQQIEHLVARIMKEKGGV